MAPDNKLQIINGPGKWDLMLALFEPWVGSRTRTVRFIVLTTDKPEEIPHEVESTINRVAAESGDGNNWLFGGNFIGGQRDKIDGYYNTQTRRGWMSLEP